MTYKLLKKDTEQIISIRIVRSKEVIDTLMDMGASSVSQEDASIEDEEVMIRLIYSLGSN